MEPNQLHREILLKKEKLNEISDALKAHFIGLDAIIDELMNLVSAWYLFPQAQLRPMVVNLWGMTGSGKTALVKKLVELLDYKKLYAQMDMGEFESDSASWFKSTLTDDLEFFHEQPCMICLDEFQFARTIDKNGEELGKDKLRVIWDLIDSGRINYLPYNNAFYLKRADACLIILLKAKEKGIEIENGIVVKNEEAFLEIFKSFYFDNQNRSEAMDKNYFVSNDFVEGLFYLTTDDNLSRDSIRQELKKASLSSIAELVVAGIKSRSALKELDLSKALIFVLGNLDEAYGMSHSINPDISADDLHADTLRINITNIKAALKKRFRSEQIARLGNNHLIYRAFKSEHFRELIKRELQRVNLFIKQQFNFEINYHASVHELVYKEGVFPAQGTRPVLTTIKNYVETWVSKIAIEVIGKQLAVAMVEWSYQDDKYVFIFKDNQNSILNIYEEKVILKIDSLRKTVDKDLQAHTAVHEAGHAVLAAMTLRILPSLIVSKSAADGCDGFCMVNMPEGLFTRDVLKKDIIICLGGYVAEKMIFGEENTSSGVYSDIENATNLANKAIKYYAMGSDPISIAVSAPANNEYFFMNETHRQEAMLLIRDCQKEAEELLEKNKLLLLKISEYLVDTHKMEEPVIADFVRKYGVEDWVRTEGFKKKENYFSFESVLKKQIHELESNRHLIKVN
jgi:cell division protease FtsH